MKQITENLLSRLISLRAKQGDTIDAGDAAMIVNEIVDMMEKYQEETEKSLYDDIKSISSKIQQVKLELAEKLPDGVVPEATKELDAVVQSTEDATNRILDSAEKIQAVVATLGPCIEADQINEQVTGIFEACNFQDITGQRIKKVTSTLQFIEDAVDNIISSIEGRHNAMTGKVAPIKKAKKSIDEMSNADLLNGPQLKEDAPSQDDVDRLFDSA